MFNCRVCANPPFNTLFGYVDDTAKVKKANSSEPNYSDSSSSEYSEEGFSERSPGEVVEKVNEWFECLHERPREIWNESETRDVLSQVAKGVSKEDDPVIGEAEFCCIWHGEKNSSGDPVIWTVNPKKPGTDKSKSASLVRTYTTRGLVYMFADDASYTELQQRPDKQPFDMACHNRLCVKLDHIPLDS